jgi:hypothetical protein
MERWATAGTHTLPDAKLEPAQSETSPRFGSAPNSDRPNPHDGTSVYAGRRTTL